MEKNEQTTTSGVAFQELLRKIEVSNNEDDRRNRISQGISLCNELIDIVEKTTLFTFDDFQNCWESLSKILSTFESNVAVEDEKSFVREVFLHYSICSVNHKFVRI